MLWPRPLQVRSRVEVESRFTKAMEALSALEARHCWSKQHNFNWQDGGGQECRNF